MSVDGDIILESQKGLKMKQAAEIRGRRVVWLINPKSRKVSNKKLYNKGREKKEAMRFP